MLGRNYGELVKSSGPERLRAGSPPQRGRGRALQQERGQPRQQGQRAHLHSCCRASFCIQRPRRRGRGQQQRRTGQQQGLPALREPPERELGRGRVRGIQHQPGREQPQREQGQPREQVRGRALQRLRGQSQQQGQRAHLRSCCRA